MLRLASSLFIAASLIGTVGCLTPGEDEGEEILGDIGDGKSDSFGVVDREVTVSAGHSRRFTFTAGGGFRIALTQPGVDADQRSELTLSLKKPDGSRVTADAAVEPGLVIEAGTEGSYTLTVKNVGDNDVLAILNVRPMGGFAGLPDPNASVFPDAAWQPPAVDTWPASYVIFNNTGCGHDCAQTDQTALAPRSVMVKMLVAAIHEVKQGGTVRVSNFNISGSNGVKPVVDALLWAMRERGATVKVVMDQAQNNATSRTTQLANEGAQVRFLEGMRYQTSTGNASVGIMHSKIVAVDDQIVFTGSNNFSSTGVITNEENSVVVRGPSNADRIRSFTCDVDVMFEAGVEPGKPQKTDAERNGVIRTLDDCNGADTWFPPTGVLANGSSITYTQVTRAIAGSKRSIDLAPDMLAHPGLVSAIISRGKKAKALGQPFAVKLVLDASEEALGNPAFGECLTEGAEKYGLDISVKYWPGTAAIFQLMHHKFMIIDAEDPSGATVYNGSANYSAKALKWSFENVTRYTGSPYRQVVDAFTARFTQLYGQSKTKEELAAQDGLEVPNCPLDLDSL